MDLWIYDSVRLPHASANLFLFSILLLEDVAIGTLVPIALSLPSRPAAFEEWRERRSATRSLCPRGASAAAAP